LNEDKICDINFIEKLNSYKTNQTADVQTYCLSSDICINCSDEDKTQILNLQNIKNLPDITLNLNCDHLQGNSPADSCLTYSDIMNRGYSSNSNSSEDDFKSLTPSQDDDGTDGKTGDGLKLAPPTIVTTTHIKLFNVNDTNGPASDTVTEAENLKNELEASKIIFEEERLKWAEEKEKVLDYHRQLQNNYVEILKRTQELESKLLTVDKNIQEIGDTELL
jgi:Fez1